MNSITQLSLAKLFTLVLLLTFQPFAWATPEGVILPESLTGDQPSWEKKLDKENVEIFTREHAGSTIKAFKAIATLDAPLTQVMAVMANPNSCVEWVHGCIVSYGFDAKSFNDRHAYSVNDLPWPVADRDYVLKISTWREPDSGRIWMEMHAVTDKKPVTTQYERVTVAQTIYVFESTEDNKTQMTWLQHTEPGGALPSWLVNALLIDIPFKSLRKLEEVANWDKYNKGEMLIDAQGELTGVKNTGASQ